MDTKQAKQNEIDKLEKRIQELREDYATHRIRQNSGRMKFIENLAKMHKSRVAYLKAQLGEE